MESNATNDDILSYAKWVVIPKTLQKRMIKVFHVGHPRIARMKLPHENLRVLLEYGKTNCETGKTMYEMHCSSKCAPGAADSKMTK